MPVRRSAALAAVLALLAVAAQPLSAQWPRHRSTSAPRTADGAADVQAAAPRTRAGTPDLSGVWENVGWRELQQQSGDVSGTGGSPGTRGVLGGAAGLLAGGPGLFFDIGTGVQGGLPLQPWAAVLKQQRVAANSKDNPDAHCLPLGNMQLHTHPQPRKIVQTSKVMLIMYEANYGLRQIFTDGRRLPDGDPQPWWYGYSVGRWEGDTLVVESAGFRDDGWLDVNGSPLTDRGRMIERYRRENYGTMTVDVTVDDPKAYTRPWSVTLTHRLMPDDDLIEFICNENEKSSAHFTK